MNSYSATVLVLIVMIWFPLYVPHVGQTRCVGFIVPHCEQAPSGTGLMWS